MGVPGIIPGRYPDDICWVKRSFFNRGREMALPATGSSPCGTVDTTLRS